MNDDFKTVDLMLAGMTRVKPNYRTFVYNPTPRFIFTLGGDDSIIEGEHVITEVIYEFDDETFYFWADRKCVYQTHESEWFEIGELLTVEALTEPH